MNHINLKGILFNEDRLRDIESAIYNLDQTIESITLSRFDFSMLLISQGLGLNKPDHLIIFQGDIMSIPILVNEAQIAGLGILIIKDKKGKETELILAHIKIDMTNIRLPFAPDDFEYSY